MAKKKKTWGPSNPLYRYLQKRRTPKQSTHNKRSVHMAKKRKYKTRNYFSPRRVKAYKSSAFSMLKTALFSAAAAQMVAAVVPQTDSINVYGLSAGRAAVGALVAGGNIKNRAIGAIGAAAFPMVVGTAANMSPLRNATTSASSGSW